MPVYKDKNRGTWYTSFYYTDWSGVRQRKKKEGFKKRSEAVAYEDEFRKKQEGETDMSLGSLVELYMEDCKARLRLSTYLGKEFLINSKILPVFKEQPVNSITPAMVRRWQNSLIEDDEDYSPTYLKTINNQLSAIFNFAKRYYGLRSNPAAVTGSMGKKKAEAMQFWTVGEFNTFIDAVRDKPASYALFNILFWTGIRCGELLALCLSDFNFTRGELSITKNYARIGNEDYIFEPKTPKSRRVITVPDFLLSIIREYAAKLYDYSPNERLFEYTKFYVEREMARGCKISGVKKIRVHDLRHSHASLLIDMGFSPLTVSERLGHESTKTTLEIYAHLYPGTQAQVAAKLESLNNREKQPRTKNVLQLSEYLNNMGKMENKSTE